MNVKIAKARINKFLWDETPVEGSATCEVYVAYSDNSFIRKESERIAHIENLASSLLNFGDVEYISITKSYKTSWDVKLQTLIEN